MLPDIAPTRKAGTIVVAGATLIVAIFAAVETSNPGADGLTLIPYLEGERTPNLPNATGAIHGLRLATATPQHLARAAIRGMLCGLADALDALTDLSVTLDRVVLVGGAAASEAVRTIAPTVLGRPVHVPPPAEAVADGAARQAAWVLTGDL